VIILMKLDREQNSVTWKNGTKFLPYVSENLVKLSLTVCAW